MPVAVNIFRQYGESDSSLRNRMLQKVNQDDLSRGK